VGKDVGDAYTTNDDLAWKVGVGLGEPQFITRSTPYAKRVLNGVVQYDVQYTQPPTMVPTTSPVTHAEEFYDVSKSLETTMKGGNGSYGIMFNIVAKHTLVVTTLSIHTDMVTNVNVTVYSKPGSYVGAELPNSLDPIRAQEEEINGWREVSPSQVLKGRGYQNPTELSSDLFDAITVRADDTQAFYITMETPDLRYTDSPLTASNTRIENNNQRGANVYVSNVDLEIEVGSGIGEAYPVQEQSSIYPQRIFNGLVHYNVEEERTNTPTANPTIKGMTAISSGGEDGKLSLMTQQKISLEGMESLVLDEAMIAFLEGHVSGFLNDFIDRQGNDGTYESNTVQITDVIISPPEIFSGTNAKDLTFLEQESNMQDGEYDSHQRRLQSSSNEPSTDVYATIFGEYRPPPKIDFTILVQDTFDDKGTVFIGELKKDSPEVFAVVKDLRVAPVRYDPPTRPPTPSPVSESDVALLAELPFMERDYLLGMIGGGVILLVFIVCVCCACRYFKKKRIFDKASVRLQTTHPENYFCPSNPAQHFSNSTVATIACTEYDPRSFASRGLPPGSSHQGLGRHSSYHAPSRSRQGLARQPSCYSQDMSQQQPSSRGFPSYY